VPTPGCRHEAEAICERLANGLGTVIGRTAALAGKRARIEYVTADREA
jgi:hypothetical protein